MAKLRGKAKAAFLRRMAKGRAKARRSSGVKTRRSSTKVKRRKPARRRGGFAGSIYASRKRPGVVRFRIRRNPLQALIANPDWVPALYGADSAARKRRPSRHKKGASTMAKRKRRRSTKRRARRAAAPKSRRVYRRRPRTTHRRRRRRGGGSGFAHVRRGTRVIYINPRRRRHGRRRRRHNPGFGGILKRAFVPYAAGIITSAATAMLDTGLAKMPVVRQLVKVGGVVAIAAFLGRKHPQASAAAIGALGASQGYPLVTKLAGGLVARTPAEAVKGLGEMTATYPEMGALLQGGLGALLQGPTDVPDVAANYETALMNMADDDDDS